MENGCGGWTDSSFLERRPPSHKQNEQAAVLLEGSYLPLERSLYFPESSIHEWTIRSSRHHFSRRTGTGFYVLLLFTTE